MRRGLVSGITIFSALIPFVSATQPLVSDPDYSITISLGVIAFISCLLFIFWAHLNRIPPKARSSEKRTISSYLAFCEHKQVPKDDVRGVLRASGHSVSSTANLLMKYSS